ncbi:MAG: hypothetical protein AAGA30_09080 [Planctomycetota bacterium]
MSDPAFVKIEPDKLTISASPNGTYVVSKRKDFSFPKMKLQATVTDGAEVFIVRHGRGGTTGLTGMNSGIRVVDGLIQFDKANPIFGVDSE